MVSSRPSFGDVSRCRNNASLTWLPTVCIGDSEVIGSWKIIEMRLPRIARNSRLSWFMSARSTVVPPAAGSSSRI